MEKKIMVDERGGGPNCDAPDDRVRASKWIVCDRLGWPIEKIRGRWFSNTLRLLIHGRRLRYWTGTGSFK